MKNKDKTTAEDIVAVVTVQNSLVPVSIIGLIATIEVINTENITKIITTSEDQVNVNFIPQYATLRSQTYKYLLFSIHCMLTF